MKDFIIFKNLEDKYVTLPEYVEATKQEGKEEEQHTVYYVTDVLQQSQYINMFKEAGMDAVLLTHNIDQAFLSSLEQTEEKVKFQRIDADVTDSFKEEVSKDDEEALKTKTEALTEKFRAVLGKEKLEVKVEKLKNQKVSSMITISEESRRMQDMMRMYSMNGMNFGGEDMFSAGETLVLNANNELVQYVFDHKDEETVDIFCEQLYDLASIANKPLSSEAMTKFIERSNQIMMLLAK